MRKRTLMVLGMCALPALLAGLTVWEAGRPAPPEAADPAVSTHAAAPPAADDDLARTAPRPPGAATAVEEDEALDKGSAGAPRKIGVALAESYRDDICRCQTKACWHEASGAYAKSVGLAQASSPEEARSIEEAMSATIACIQRIGATESGEALGAEVAD